MVHHKKEMELISKEEAKEKGLKNYYPGILCSKGHLDYRFVSSNTCKACNREYIKNRKNIRAPSGNSWYYKPWVLTQEQKLFFSPTLD
jgi:hypothetical protein